MAKTVTVRLREPIVGHQGAVTEIVLRPPNLVEYARIGDPVSVVPDGGGGGIVVDNDAAIAAYVEACTVEPRDKLLLAQVSLADAMDVKDAILGFFAAARLARTSPNSPTSSSSTSS
jgi:hypothetical protein